MPRNPSTKIFSYSAGVPAEAGDTLSSSDYNAAIGDLVTDFNRALDIEMGGTGASSLETALTNIEAVSTFYLSQLFAGATAFFARSTPPTGWLLANGQAISRSTYRSLYLRIGTAFGSGDGSTTFNVPDLRGYFIRGADQGRGIDSGRAVGSSQDDDNEEHTHTGTAANGGAHTHTHARYALVTGPSPPISLVIESDIGLDQTIGGNSTGLSSDHTHTVTIDSTGSEFRPKNIALLGCIKT